jgi:hypothetical protein
MEALEYRPVLLMGTPAGVWPVTTNRFRLLNGRD